MTDKKYIDREKKRRKGYEKWLKKMRKEKEKEKKLKEKEKEKEKKRKEKEKLKKKVGRPKKRGPRKQRKKKIIKPLPKYHTFDYKIVDCHNGKQVGYIGAYIEIEDAYSKIEELMKESEKVVFPKNITTSSCVKNNSINEYLILVKNRDLSKSNPLIRNEYGKLIEHRLNTEKWVILDKFKYNIEETFWVYGYHPNTERKTFEWIYNNLLIGKMIDSSEIIRVLIYKNKIIFKNDDGKKEMILCKNQSDAIRFYNLLEEKINADGYNNVFFIGSYTQISDKRKRLEEELIKWTGWDKYKIQKSTTTKSQKK